MLSNNRPQGNPQLHVPASTALLYVSSSLIRPYTPHPSLKNTIKCRPGVGVIKPMRSAVRTSVLIMTSLYMVRRGGSS